MTCYLVGAAPAATKIEPRPGDFVLAVDGGLDHLRRWGVSPDFFLGDCDSVQSPVPAGVPSVRYPGQKDETDMELALLEGLRRGFFRFEIVGGSGGRPDHGFANVQLLVKAARHSAFAVLRGEDYSATALTDQGSLTLRGSGTFSLFAYGEAAAGVTVRGAQYALDGETLQGDTPRGVSNVLDGGEAEISLESGVLLVYWQSDGVEPLANA
jgi:thiamine pyrophosphokinase